MPAVETKSDAQVPSVEKVDDIVRRLNSIYGPRPWRKHGESLDELIATVLSQHTSDANTARACANLRRCFSTWETVRAASPEDVEEAISSGGLARVKARRIQRLLATVRDEYGQLSLDSLSELPPEEARTALIKLEGVGPKTAACVLLFSFGWPALPVDTHVHRVALRLGLIPSDVSAENAHPRLEEMVGRDRDRVYAFHMNVIQHGRQVCHAQRPRCDRCMLAEKCDYFANHTNSEMESTR